MIFSSRQGQAGILPGKPVRTFWRNVVYFTLKWMESSTDFVVVLFTWWNVKSRVRLVEKWKKERKKEKNGQTDVEYFSSLSRLSFLSWLTWWLLFGIEPEDGNHGGAKPVYSVHRVKIGQTWRAGQSKSCFPLWQWLSQLQRLSPHPSLRKWIILCLVFGKSMAARPKSKS